MKKFILMSTTAYTTETEKETQARKTSIVLSILKLFLPPHRDNMHAADFLIRDLRASPYLEWTAVRPDTLIDEDVVKTYDVCEHRQRDPLSNPGKTSRI